MQRAGRRPTSEPFTLPRGGHTWVGSVLNTACVMLATCVPAQNAVTRVEDSTETEYTVEFTFDVPAPWPAGGEIRILFDETEAGDGYALVIEKSRCRFVRTSGGKVQALGAVAPFQAPSGQCRGAIKRRLARMSAIINGQRTAIAVDEAFHGGAVAWSASHEDLKLTDVHVQPVAPVEFTDDFVREGDDAGGWDQLAGEWQTVGLNTKGARPELSANPFSLSGKVGDDREFGLAAVGDWFWDDYRATVAAKAEAAGGMGVVAYLQDADNFLLFRWTTGDAGDGEPAGPTGLRQLVRVRLGEWEVLDESAGGFHPDRWYELGLAVRGSWIEATVDGQVVAGARDVSFGHGRLGLFCEGPGAVHFDDVDVRSTHGHRDTFDTNALGWWQARTGKWSPRREHLYGSAGRKASAQVTIGDATWSRYGISTAAKPKEASAVGLTAYRQTDGACYAFRWRGDGRQTLSLDRADGSTVLAEGRQAVNAARFYRLGLEVGGGRVAALVDGAVALKAADTALNSGPAGLLVGGPGEACFDDVAISFDETRPPSFSITAQFTEEDTMQNWVDAVRQWRKSGDNTYWYDLPVFGDLTLWLPEVEVSAAEGKLTLVLAEEAGERPTAWAEVATQGGSAELRAVLGGAAGAEGRPTGRAELEGRPRLSFVRKGACLSVCADGRPVAALADPGVRGRGVGLRLAGFPARLSQVRVSSPHLVDITFSGAPTNWSPQLGVWEVTDRWPCAPGWSWFGGSKHQSPLLWSKDILEGDQVLEFWAALMMDMPPPGYKHASDINAILCGDGENLCSGYSFILAGDNNKRSKMLKGNDVVGINSLMRFINPVSNNFDFHRHWFDIRIRKTGDHLTYSVDDEQVAEWTDPEPLAGGRVGFWSWQENGIVIARARMAAERIHR